MTLGLTGKVAPYKAGFGPVSRRDLPRGVPECAVRRQRRGRARFGRDDPVKNDIEADRVAAFIVEPVQGEGGFYVAPPKFVIAA